MIRFIGRGAALSVLALALTAVGILGLHAWFQHQTAEAVAIHSPHGVDEEQFVQINGIEQWITIRGQDRRNPALLILHGGPGVPFSYLLRQFQPMERNYVVVQWDQRGGGKTLARNGGMVDPTIDMARMVTGSRSANTCANTCIAIKLSSSATPSAPNSAPRWPMRGRTCSRPL